MAILRPTSGFLLGLQSMIKGRVTADRTPVIRLEVLDGLGRSVPVAAVLDTGFNGDVSLPIPTIRRLQLRPIGQRRFTLADGEVSVMNTYLGRANWHEEPLEVIIVESQGTAMVGMNLLWGSRITLEASEDGDILIEKFPLHE